MPDITMCKGIDCPVNTRCRRYTATPSERQSWFTTVPFKDGKCDFYWGEQSDDIWNQLTKIVKPDYGEGEE